jgi:hypothetical protein
MELAVLDQDWNARSGSILKCISLPIERVAAGDLCSYGTAQDTSPPVLVWGDSHAMALLPAYEQMALSHNLHLYFAVKFACRPLVGVANRTDNAAQRTACTRFNAAVVQAVERLRPGLVILNAHWIHEDADLVPWDDSAAALHESNFMRGLESTLLGVASGKREVCVVLDVPSFPYSVPYAVGMARRRGISEDFMKLARTDALAQFKVPERDLRLLQRSG